MKSRTERPAGQAPKRRMTAADRRQVILDAALQLFAERGFSGTSLEEVASRAGISKALIYEHFDAKQELHDALIETSGRELLQQVLSVAAEAEPGEARLRAGVEAFLTFVEEHRDAWRMIFRHLEDPGTAAWVDRLRSQAATTISALIASEVPPARTGPVDTAVAVEMLAEQLVGSALALANWWDDHGHVPRDQVLELFMDFAFIGLDRLSSGERWRG